jgi:muramidase (phage lysozyme)
VARLTAIGRNLNAFLDMLAWSEGTAGRGDDGYNVLVGGTLFEGYSDHPRILVDLPRLKIKSTAAGRYQLLQRYFDAYRRQLSLPDFSPVSQDKIAIQQIRERGALPAIEQGDLAEAVNRCRNIWASLPGAGYGQHEHKLANLREQFVKAGGLAV